MRNVILAIIFTAGLCIPFSFLAGTLCFGRRINIIEAAEASIKQRPLPETAHFKKLTADSIQLVDEKGRSRIELFYCGSGTGYAAINFTDYFKTDNGKDDYMTKMILYSYGNGEVAGMRIDSPPNKTLYDFDLQCDTGGPKIEMHKNDTLFNLSIAPDEIGMKVQQTKFLEITPFEIKQKHL